MRTTQAAAVCLATLIGCSSGGGRAPGTPRPVKTEPLTHAPDRSASSEPPLDPVEVERQQRLIARMVKKVSAVRGLEAKKEVPGRIMSRQALLARVKAHVAKEIPTEAIREEGLVLQLLGFVPTKFDYEAETFALLEAQLAGFYEPADGTMYMAGDLDEDSARATLAHELVHALQDMHYDLGPKSKYKPGQGDRSSATSALAEGDATSAMLDVLIGTSGRTALDVPEELFSEQVMSSVNNGPGSNAPHAMRASLVAPYVDGTLFIHALRKRGGWAEVDKAWKKPPVTTEQILHLDKYDAHEAELDVSAPSADGLGKGYDAVQADTYGELGARITFGEWMDAERARSAAAHWGGDRGVLVKNGETFALGWHLRYDPGTQAHDGMWADQAFAALATALEAKVGPATSKETSAAKGSWLCIQRPKLGPLAVLRRGRDLALIAGPTRTAPGGEWTPAADCAGVRGWAESMTK